MYSIRRIYNQNRRIIWITIIIIAFIIIIIKLMNYVATINLENNLVEDMQQVNHIEQTERDTYSIISEKTISEETAKSNIDIIDNFFEFCNNRQIQEAYNLLSTNCKEVLYPTLESFEKYYYENIFTTAISYSRQAWITSGRITYQIQMTEDALATGKVSKNNIIQDYYTIVDENGERKLNIASYIDRIEINKESETENIKIGVLYKDIYMDYEIYTISVSNNTLNTMMIDNLETVNSTYILGENEAKYTSYIQEISKTDATVYPQTTKNISIKFNKMYSTDVEITQIVFGSMRINNENNYMMKIDL